MSNRISSPLVVALAFAASFAVALQASADDEAAIRRIVAEQATAWNAGDGAAYAKRVAPDAAFTNLFGMVMYGAPGFAKRHIEILSTFYKGTAKKHVIRRIRFVTPDVAIVDIDNELHGVKSMPAGIAVPPDGVLKTQLMEVFVRHAGEWWIEAYHNVDVKPSASPQQGLQGPQGPTGPQGATGPQGPPANLQPSVERTVIPNVSSGNQPHFLSSNRVAAGNVSEVLATPYFLPYTPSRCSRRAPMQALTTSGWSGSSTTAEPPLKSPSI